MCSQTCRSTAVIKTFETRMWEKILFELFYTFFLFSLSVGFRAPCQAIFLSHFTLVCTSSVTDALDVYIIIFTALLFPHYFIWVLWGMLNPLGSISTKDIESYSGMTGVRVHGIQTVCTVALVEQFVPVAPCWLYTVNTFNHFLASLSNAFSIFWVCFCYIFSNLFSGNISCYI